VTATAPGFPPTSSYACATRAYDFAWLCIVAGILLAVAAFVIAATKPMTNPWSILIAGFA
jgi:hypothetical protein